MSGGSFASVSETFAPCTVTVHVSFWPKSVPGLSAYVPGPPVTVAVWAPVVEHAIPNQSPVVATSSLNVTLTSLSTATSEAPLAGSVEATVGARSASQKRRAVPLLRGAVAAASKSAALSSVSTQPPVLRCAEVLLVSAGAGPVPSKKFAPP